MRFGLHLIFSFYMVIYKATGGPGKQTVQPVSVDALVKSSGNSEVVTMVVTQDDFNYFVSVKQLVEQIKQRRDMLRCRTVGIVASDYGKFFIQEVSFFSAAIFGS